MTLKELREKSVEQLIAIVISTSCSTTKAAIQQEERVFKVLAERGVLDYNAMRTEMKRRDLWR